MILDAQHVATGQTMEADVCIVGAGAMGVAMALELAKAGTDVLLLEAGGAAREEQSHDFYKGKVMDTALHQPLEDHRERRFGGTTTIWGGRLVPYDPIDFEERSWMAGSEWPITYEDAAKWFGLATRYCEGGEADYLAESTFHGNYKPMIEGFGNKAFTTDTLERFSAPTDFGTRYRVKLEESKKIRVMLNAAAFHVGLDETGATVARLEVKKPSGESIFVHAKRYVLAAGGLETTRLMLASNDVQKDGVGNQHGNLGRFYMAHIAGTVGAFAPVGAVDNAYQIADDGVYCRRRLSLRPEMQREYRVGGFIARLHHTRISDPSHGSGVLSAMRLGRSLVPVRFRTRLAEDVASTGDMVKHAINVATDLPSIIGFTRQMIFDRRLASRKYPSVVIKPKSRRYSLDFHAEQEPNWNSVVRLGSDVDAFGMRRLEVDWRYTKKDFETIAVPLKLFAEEVAAEGCGRFEYDPAQVEAEMTRYGAYGGHHLGTTRMGADPKRSVVDADAKVHDVNNLYCAGCSVFTTSSQANPTLTALALALRLADHLNTKGAA